MELGQAKGKSSCRVSGRLKIFEEYNQVVSGGYRMRLATLMRVYCPRCKKEVAVTAEDSKHCAERTVHVHCLSCNARLLLTPARSAVKRIEC